MLDQLVHYDKELFLFLNNLGSAKWDGFWLFMTNKWSSIPLYALLAFFTYRAFGLKRLLMTLVAIAVLILVTDQLANFFKYGVQRLRPCHDNEINGLMRLVKSSCGGKFGYFSAHAANSFAVAIFFTFFLRTKYKYIGRADRNNYRYFFGRIISTAFFKGRFQIQSLTPAPIAV